MESRRYKAYNDNVHGYMNKWTTNNLNREDLEKILANSAKPNKVMPEIFDDVKIDISEEYFDLISKEISNENIVDAQLEADNMFKKEIFKLYSTSGSELVKYYEELDCEADSSLSRIYRRAVSTVPMIYDTFTKCIDELFSSLSEPDKMICSLECAIESNVELEERGINNRILDHEIASNSVDAAYNYWRVIYHSLSNVEDKSIEGLKKELRRLQSKEFKTTNNSDISTKIKMIRIYLSAIRSNDIDRYLELAEHAIEVAKGGLVSAEDKEIYEDVLTECLEENKCR